MISRLIQGFLIALVLLGPVAGFVGAGTAAGIVLSEDCPPGFELAAGHCELRSLYQMYPSLEDAGVGGLKTGLPDYRDGFTPQQTDLGRYLFFDPVLSAAARRRSPTTVLRAVMMRTSPNRARCTRVRDA